MIRARAVRRLAVAVCVPGVAGMIVASALDHNGVAITIGLVTAAAVLGSMLATAVEAAESGRPAPAAGRGADPDALALVVEERVRTLVDEGADETEVRVLVGEAVRLGQALRT
jgi:hypothetical protein